MNNKELEVIEAMGKFGGRFVQSLAKCFKHADAVNFNKLKTTFIDYWRQYDEIAEIRIRKTRNIN